MQHTLSDEHLRALLANARTIAIVGAKDKPGQPVDGVGRYLIQAGYTVIPVHPVRREVWGIPAVASLAEIHCPVDIIDVFRAPEFCPAHAVEAASMQPLPALFWMQLGIANAEARRNAEAAGMEVIEDACLMVEHRRLFREHA